jgi:hypothetical protein
MFTTRPLTMVKLWNHPRCPLMEEWIRKTYTQWGFIHPLRRMKLGIW